MRASERKDIRAMDSFCHDFSEKEKKRKRMRIKEREEEYIGSCMVMDKGRERDREAEKGKGTQWETECDREIGQSEGEIKRNEREDSGRDRKET